jgi:hypothetical protein
MATMTEAKIPESPARRTHALLSNDGSHGFAYGVLRDFEDEIVRLTGATRHSMPAWRGPAPIHDRLAHGTRFARLRGLVPKQVGFEVKADVLWVVLMGPEDSSLDLLHAWDGKVGKRILYLFDTFEDQLPAVRRLVAAARWDHLITSFHGAIPMLERETGRRWSAVTQGVKLDRFLPVPAGQRVIPVSSYGRRIAPVHRAIEAWSTERGLHYETSIAASIQPSVDSRYLYKQYAWHLRHSSFNVCWPVEITHPTRVGSMSPITCRWFESAAAATTMIGAAPRDPLFTELFGPDAVIPLDPTARSPGAIHEALDALYEDREAHLARALARRAERSDRWTWEARVHEILTLAGLD